VGGIEGALNSPLVWSVAIVGFNTAMGAQYLGRDGGPSLAGAGVGFTASLLLMFLMYG